MMKCDRGSIPLALLVAIIVAGLAAVLISRTIAETRATGTDRDFASALHVAEAGVNEALFRLNNDIPPVDADSGTPSSGDGEYSWEAVEHEDETWTITSTGLYGDSERIVEVRAEPQPLFEVAAFAEEQIGMAGANGADSYVSSTDEPTTNNDGDPCVWEEDAEDNNGNDPGQICSTGAGIIGTNGTVDMDGNAFADQVLMYNWADDPDPDRCESGGNTDFCDEPWRENVDRPLEFAWQADVVEWEMDECDGQWDTWQASDYEPDADGYVELDLGPTGFEDRVCIDELIFDRSVKIPAGWDTPDPDSGQIGDTVRIFVRDRIVIGQEGNADKVEVNCEGCQDGIQRPVSTFLQIFTTSDPPGEDVLTVYNQTRFAGAIFAPYGSCGVPGSGGSNAQVDIYGSLVCEDMRNVGGWNFHYDEDLRYAETTGQYHVVSWTEQ